MDTMQASYDEEPYADLTHAQTHPELLATIGRLLGLSPANIEHCRVLELGCGAGANISAMAEALPEAEFVGIDYSERQVMEGRAAVEELSLNNVHLYQADIREMEMLGLGTFDFIVAHGVYSWVPADVRDRMLAGCKTMLNAQGIVYVSYNAYPGWYLMQGLRDAMLYRTRGTLSPRERALEAEEFADVLRRAVSQRGDGYGQMLEAYQSHKEGRRRIGGERAASLLLHDELAEINDPCYFHEFAAHAGSHGLQYLADADFPSIFPTRLPQDAQSALRKHARDVVEYQQYLDFMTNAAFRQTLLCHDGQSVTRRLGEDLDVLRGLFVGSPARTEGRAGAVQRFAGSDGAILAIDNPIGKAAMSVLCERYPSRVSFPELVKQARDRLGPERPEDPNDEAQLGAVLLQGFCYSSSLVEMGTVADRFTVAPGLMPRTTAFARRQVAGGMPSVTNLRHERLNVEPLQARLIGLFDGTRTRGDVARVLAEDPEGSGRAPVTRRGGGKDSSVAGVLEREVQRLTEMAMFRA